MTLPKKRIAVIGGGLSGNGCIAMLKNEGLEPVCFEKTDKPGGTWCYREEAIDGLTSIMPTTIINHSKEMGAVSNFPPRKEFSNYMRHSELHQYFLHCTQANDTLRYIRYNSEVIDVKKANDYKDTGRWVVTVKDTLTAGISTDVYDGVMVCVGHMSKPNLATYPHQETFKGKIMHTHTLKRVTEFEGQVVVIIGMGCSALDAAVEISSVAKQVYLSTRSGAHVVSRVGPHGYPIDFILFRRYITKFLEILPTNFCSWFIEKMYLDPKFDHRFYAVQPKYHFLSREPNVNDHIASKLLSGSVVQKCNISYFTEHGVVFEEDDHVTAADTVIMATGYTWGFPFLEKGAITTEEGQINLYQLVFPPQLKHPTLAFIGFVLPFGPGFPIGEIQCRWAAKVFSGKCVLPPEVEMMADIKTKYKRNCRRFLRGEKLSIRVDFQPYMDEIASLIGAKPDLWKLFFTDIRLWLRLIFGPSLPYQYRLQGPDSWEGAREAIMTVDDRLQWPLKRRENRTKGFFQTVLSILTNMIPKNFFF